MATETVAGGPVITLQLRYYQKQQKNSKKLDGVFINCFHKKMILSNKQCQLLLNRLYQDKITGHQQRLAIRNCTMMVLMLDSGLRICELVNLTISDLLILGKPVGTLHIVRGLPKKRGDRFIPLTDRVRHLIKMMDDYWWTPDTGKVGNFAFYNRSPIKHITTRQFERIISQATFDVFGYSISPNVLRQTCAANLLKKENLQNVQKLLDYKTTQKSFFYG